jgi:hypothetical protein
MGICISLNEQWLQKMQRVIISKIIVMEIVQLACKINNIYTQRPSFGKPIPAVDTILLTNQY